MIKQLSSFASLVQPLSAFALFLNTFALNVPYSAVSPHPTAGVILVCGVLPAPILFSTTVFTLKHYSWIIPTPNFFGFH